MQIMRVPFYVYICAFFPPPLAISDERQISEAVYNLISLTKVHLETTQPLHPEPIAAADPAVYSYTVF